MNYTNETLRKLAANAGSALDVGKAAEHLVCVDLILAGYQCYLSDQGLPYDLCVDFEGRIYRVQVKGTCFPKNINAAGRNERIGYTFHVRRRGKNGVGKRLDSSHCDLVALVALDIREIAYLPVEDVGSTCQFSCPQTPFVGTSKSGSSLRDIRDHSFASALGQIERVQI